MTGQPECVLKIPLITNTLMMTANVQTEARVQMKWKEKPRSVPVRQKRVGLIYPGSWCLQGRR